MAWLLLAIRRVAIFVIVLLGYLFYLLLGQTHGLASIGLVSFAAIAQFAPAFFGGLLWRNATARGAIAGIVTGFAVWAYTLLLPWIIEAGWLPRSIMTEGPFGLGFLSPHALFYLRLDPLTHGVLWSMAANMLSFVAVSLLRAPEPIERLQAHLFVLDDLPRPPVAPGFRMWRSSITAGELQRTVARYLGAERAERSFAEYAESSNAALSPNAEADIHLLRFTEHLLASAIGAASSRLVLSLLLRRSHAGSHSALRLLDDASEALQYNRDLLQSALDQVRHGLSVFDKDMKLICWNRQFRELLNLPPELGRVGASLDLILRTCAERGDFGPGDANKLVAERLMKLAVAHETFQEHFDDGQRILEIRTSPMPQGGIVTTYSDITERVEAAEALARANETLERRVRERTAELTEVNLALAVAKGKADEANLDKTRFLAAASHDVLQPLNAARLYATSLVERPMPSPEAKLVRNIDASLDAVEEILNVLIEISRLDAGRLEPDITVFALSDVFERLEVEFSPLAREKGLELLIVPTRLWVSSDRRLLRRVLQNLVSNAIKYTAKGKVLVGVRRHGNKLSVQVGDTGPGIPKGKRSLIFKEFERLEETAHSVRGLGLGLAIVERIGKVLDHAIDMRSVLGPRLAVHGGAAPGGAPACGRSGDDRGTHCWPHCRVDGAVHRQRARRAQRHAGAARRLGMHCPDRAECAGGHRRAPSHGRTTRHHSGRLPSRRRHGAGGRGGPAQRHAIADPGDRHHGGPLGRGAARDPQARLRPAAQAAQGGRPARAHVPAHAAARGGGGISLLGQRQFGMRGQSADAPILLMAITACVRLSTPSFCRMAETCALMVASETPSLKAICLLSSPSPSIMSTRTCCGVSVDRRETSSAVSPVGTLLRSRSGGSHTSPPMILRMASRIASTGWDFGMKPEAPQSRQCRIVPASSLADTITTGTSGCWARRYRRPDTPCTPGIVRSSRMRSVSLAVARRSVSSSSEPASSTSASSNASPSAWLSAPRNRG